MILTQEWQESTFLVSFRVIFPGHDYLDTVVLKVEGASEVIP